jgi:AraC-like DNA-binding protein
MNDAEHWLKPITAEGLILIQTRVAGDWGLEMPQRDVAFFHFVVEGRAYLRSEGMEPVELLPGDIVLMVQGNAHKMSHSLQSDTIPVEQFLAAADGVFSRENEATVVVCGHFGMDRHMVLPAINSLPPILHLHASGNSQIAETLKQLQRELKHREVGSQLVVRNLLSALFIYVLREWAETKPAETGSWFSALQSPHIARALARIHEKPSHGWTLDTLAGEAGLSRSAFARQFTASVGEPPHSYLTRWRIGIAAKLLEQTKLRVSEIAAQVGYTSEYSFSRAFKQARGISPGQARTHGKSNSPGENLIDA